MKKKLIEYYGVKIKISLYNHSNYEAYTHPVLYLKFIEKEKRFKKRKDAEHFINKLCKNIHGTQL